jgi:hypothetical protein
MLSCGSIPLIVAPKEAGCEMNEGIEKILIYLGRISSNIPAIQVIVGHLLARPERARFVRQITETGELAMTISAHRRIELPMAPWQGYIRGVPVPDPYTWIEAARGLGSGEVQIRISTDDARLLMMLEPWVRDDQIRAERTQIQDRVKHLREEVDQVLDIYNELRHLMAVDVDRQSELSQFLGMAEGEMHQLGSELNRLKERLGETSG